MYYANEAIEQVDALLSMQAAFRDEARRRTDLYGLYLSPKLPRDLAREDAVHILSPDLIAETKAVIAFVLAMQTEITALPTAREPDGTIKRDDQRLADNEERAAAIFWSGLTPNRTLEQFTYWDQCVTPAGIIILEAGPIESPDPAERFPWKAYNVSIDGCGWLDRDSIPTVFGRRYRQMVYDVQTRYMDRGAHEGAYPAYENGKWSWKPLTDDYTPRLRPAGSGHGFEEAEIVWLDDGKMIYCVALNDAGKSGFQVGPFSFGRKRQRTGEVLWQGENPFGRVSAFIVPGNRTPQRRPEDALEPFLAELMADVEQLNYISSVRATRSRNLAAPRTYVNPHPEAIAQWLRNNPTPGAAPPALEWEDGRSHVAMGKVELYPTGEDSDLDKLAADINERMRRHSFAAQLAGLTDPAVMKQATLGATLAAYDSSQRMIGPLVGNFDVVRRQIIEAWEESIRYYARQGKQYAEFALTAQGGERVRRTLLKSGEQVAISAEQLDYPHIISVKTYSNTDAQKAERYQMWRLTMEPLPDGRPGLGVYEDGFTALDEQDASARKVQMAKEAIMAEIVDPDLQAATPAIVRHYIALESGIALPPPAPPQLPAGGGGAVTPPPRTASPQTETVAGGSQPQGGFG